MSIMIEVGYSRSRISGASDREAALLIKEFTYTNTSVGYQTSQAYKKMRWAQKNDQTKSAEYFQKQITELEKIHRVQLPVRDADVLILPTGLISKVQALIPEWSTLDRRVVPKAKAGFPAHGKLPTLRPYQLEQKDACLSKHQGTIASATATGKTVVIQEVLRRLGLKALLVVPSISILDQTLQRFEAYFGKGRVGQYGDGKKQIRDITIACAPSILKSLPSDWEGVDVLIFDECHHVACETIERICYEFVPNAYYRFGFTATPYRADGADLAIEGGVFPPIHEYTVQKGIRQGYLTPPTFVVVEIDQSSSEKMIKDPLKQFQEHVIRNEFYNGVVINQVTAIFSKGKQIMLLVKEKEHGHLLWRALTKRGVPVNFARTKESKEDRKDFCSTHDSDESPCLPGECPNMAPWVDPTRLVEAFNKGQERVLIGTSVIGEGTDIIPVDVLFLLCGGASKGVVVQNIGRGLRLSPGKKVVLVFDYAVAVEQNGSLKTELLSKHASRRAEWFEEIGPVRRVEGRSFFNGFVNDEVL
jgi:superfamily II DNA or RNA helicase